MLKELKQIQQCLIQSNKDIVETRRSFISIVNLDNNNNIYIRKSNTIENIDVDIELKLTKAIEKQSRALFEKVKLANALHTKLAIDGIGNNNIDEIYTDRVDLDIHITNCDIQCSWYCANKHVKSFSDNVSYDKINVIYKQMIARLNTQIKQYKQTT